MNENRYALVVPTNSLRLLLDLLREHNVNTDILLRACAHAPSSKAFQEEKYELDATWMIVSQPTLTFHGRQFLKPNKLLKSLDSLGIPDVPIEVCDLILPSSYDGEKHRTRFARLNTHSRIFKKMAKEEKIPYKSLGKINQEFMSAIKEGLRSKFYRHLKISPMLMVDVNPGKEEMFDKEFVIGLRQPFMRKVFTTEALWKCTDYEVF